MLDKKHIPEKYNLLSGDNLRAFEDLLLGKYLLGELNSEDSEWFESILLDKYIEKEWAGKQMQGIKEKMEKDNALKDRYQQWLNADQALQKQVENQKIKKMISRQLEEVDIEQEKGGILRILSAKKNRPYLMLAASVIILLGVGLTFLLSNQLTSGELYADYYEPYKLDFEIQRDSLPANLFIVEAQKSFLQGEADSTILFLRRAIELEPDNWQIHLNLASIYMATENFEDAIAIYEKIPEDRPYQKETAQWYTGLCYLKLDKIEQAMVIFNEIACSESYKREEAKGLVKKIKKLQKD